jgi:Holliday junction resolvasome RuvABC endonuclease subunit
MKEPFSGRFSSVKALFPMLGAAILACQLEELPRSAVHLAPLKKHATGKGNARKPGMQAAAKAGGHLFEGR